MCDCHGISYNWWLATGRYVQDSQSRKLYLAPHINLIYCCPSVGNPDEDVKDENPNAKGSMGDILSPIPEPEVKSTEVVHEVPSPPTEGPSRKRRKGKQKESSGKILKQSSFGRREPLFLPGSSDDESGKNA